MKRFALAVLTGLASLPVSLPAFATPITYNATLTNNVAVYGEISPFASSTGTALAQYFSFYTDGLQQVSITGTRIDYAYDMSMWVLSGLYTNTTQLGSDFNVGDAAVVSFHDDEVAPPGGPFSDPRFTGTLAAGWYTVAVTNYASGIGAGSDNMFDFRLLATRVNSAAAVPEPAPMALLGLGMLTLALIRRKR